MKRSIIALLVFAVGIALLSASVIIDPCFAGQCKHENAECTINSSEKPCCPGLVCVPFNEQSGNGKCREAEPPPPPPCVPDGTAVCSTECGYEGGTIIDNCGNEIQCAPTDACEPPPPPPPPPPKPPKPPKDDKPAVLPLTGV